MVQTDGANIWRHLRLKAVSDALSAAGKVYEQVIFSDADHGFFCDQRASYHAGASEQAWALTQVFLKVNGLL